MKRIAAVLFLAALSAGLPARNILIKKLPANSSLPQAVQTKADNDHSALVQRLSALNKRISDHNAKCGKVPRKNLKLKNDCSQGNVNLFSAWAALDAAIRSHNKALEPLIQRVNWCRLNPIPMRPLESVYHVEGADQGRWDVYRAKMAAHCARCGDCTAAQALQAQMPMAALPANASRAPTASRPAGGAPCPTDEFTANEPGGAFYCCPRGFPYYSPCDAQCYSEEMFNTGRIKCSRTIRGER